MPTYTITDPQTGKTLKVTGDSPPTEQELEELFRSASAPRQELSAVDPSETSDPARAARQGFVEGATDAAGRVAVSGGKALLSALNPINTLKMVADFNPMSLGQRMGEDLVQGAPQGRAALSNIIGGLKSLNPASPDAPEAWGSIGGNLAAMKAAPAMLRGAPGALEGTGNVLQKVGNAASSRMNMGIGGLTWAMGHPGMAVAEVLAPPALKMAGKGLGAVGKALRPTPPAEVAIEAPTPPPPPTPSGKPPAIEGVAQQLGLPQSSSIPLGPSSIAPAPVQAVAESLLAPSHDVGTLGTPRVLSWKPGAGPSPGDVAALRAVEGAKATAKRLQIPVAKVNDLAPSQRPTTLPTAARDRIAARVSTLNTPESIQAYLDAAPNEMTRSFIEGLLKIR